MTGQATATTETITADELPPPVSQALAAFAERHGITGLAARAEMTVRTVTPSGPRRRLAQAAAPAISYAMLLPGLLVVVTTAAEVTVTAWQLAAAEARRITESFGGVWVTGLQLTAFRLGGTERQAIFISLAADGDGSGFETAVLDRVSS